MSENCNLTKTTTSPITPKCKSERPPQQSVRVSSRTPARSSMITEPREPAGVIKLATKAIGPLPSLWRSPGQSPCL